MRIPEADGPLIFSPYLSEMPREITLGSWREDIEKHMKYMHDFKKKYDLTFLPNGIDVGTRRIIPHGDIYRDLMEIPAFRRLFSVMQLGIWGFYCCVGTDKQPDLGAKQSRGSHSLDVSIRMEVTSRLNAFDDYMTKLAIVAGAFHDIYTPAFSDHGKFLFSSKLDEAGNIGLISKDTGIRRFLKKHGIKKDDVIAAVKGEYPVLGKMLNSTDIDIDSIAYTIRDSDHIHPLTACPDQTDLFVAYRMDPSVRDLHESVFDNNRGEVYFRDAEALRKLLYLRAFMYKNVYCSPSNRSRAAFFEEGTKRLSRNRKVSAEKMYQITDDEFDRLCRSGMGDLYPSLSSTSSDIFQEVARIRGVDLDDVRKEYRKGCLVKKQHRFNPKTSTPVFKNEYEITPFKEVFPEDAQKIEAIADSCEYIGVYRADL